jgi:hypothetical protein
MPGSIGKTGSASINRKGQTKGKLYGHDNTRKVAGRGKPVDENNGK